jgi:DNA/RNA endonuclease YhcR with UshA esterase domain
MQATNKNIKLNKMKALKKINQQIKNWIVGGLILLSSTSALAHNGIPTINAEAEKQIKEHLKPENPIAALHQTQKIEVLFTTNETGGVNFVLAKTENQITKAEIEKQFSHLHFKNLNVNVAYSIVINFKTL